MKKSNKKTKIVRKVKGILTPKLLTKIQLMKLRDLVDCYRNGQFVVMSSWFQRIAQDKKWEQSDCKKAKQYMRALFDTSTGVTAFVTIDIDIVENCLKNEIRKSEGDIKNLYKDILAELQTLKENGAEALILDGQNRLQFALLKYYNGDISCDIPVADGYLRDVFYEELSADLKKQIDNLPVQYIECTSDCITNITDLIIALNEGVKWSEHEKRIIRLTSVNYNIFKIVNKGGIMGDLWTFLNDEKALSNDYGSSNKGESLFLLEMLYIMRNHTIGNASQLNDLVDVQDEKVLGQIKFLDDMVFWLRKHLSRKCYQTFNKKFSLFATLFQFMLSLTYKGGLPSSNLFEKQYDLKQIKNPQLFLEELTSELLNMHQDDTKWETNAKGQKIPKVNTFPSFCMNAKKDNALVGKIEEFRPVMNKLLNGWIGKDIISPAKIRRSIDAYTKTEVRRKYKSKVITNPHQFKSILPRDPSIDHGIRVEDGGTNDVDNLEIVPKKDNSRTSQFSRKEL